MAKKPGSMWGRVAVVLGAGSLLPLAGVVPAVGALLAGAVCLAWVRRKPELRELKFRGWLAIVMAATGLCLSAAEIWGFLEWKQAQARVQRRGVTVLRLHALKQALDGYLALHGTYPEASNATELHRALVPEITPESPTRDGWGREFQVMSGAGGYRIGVQPRSAPGSHASPGSPPSAPSQTRSASTAELTMPPAHPDPSPTR